MRKQIALGLAGVVVLIGLARILSAPASDATLVLHTIAVGAGANLFPLAIDSQTGRAFVIDRSTNRVSVVATAHGTLVRTVQAAGLASSNATSLVLPQPPPPWMPGSISVLDTSR